MWHFVNMMTTLVWWFVLIRGKNAAIAILTANTAAEATISVSTESSSDLINTTPVLRQSEHRPGVSLSILESSLSSSSSLPNELPTSPVLSSSFLSSHYVKSQRFEDVAATSRHFEESPSSLDEVNILSRIAMTEAQKKSLPDSPVEAAPPLSSVLEVTPNSAHGVPETNLFDGVGETVHFVDVIGRHSTEHPHLSTAPLQIRSSSSNGPLRDSSSSKLNISVSTAISTSTSTRVFVRSSNRKHERKQAGFQDIISGLVKLLGGKNVRVANGNVPLLDNLTDSGDLELSGSRINHRAPPKVTFADPDIQLSIRPTTSSLYTSTTSTLDIVRPSAASQPGILSTSTLLTSHTTSVDQPSVFEDKIATLLVSSLSSVDGKEQSTTSEETTPTEKLPTGPITEWLPVQGIAVGFRPKVTSTRTTTSELSRTTHSSSTTLTHSTSASVAATSVSTSTEVSSTIVKPANEATQLPTEISYAGNAPSKSSIVEVTATKSSEEPVLVKPTIVTEPTHSTNDQAPKPISGTVYPIQKPDNGVPPRDTVGATDTNSDPAETGDILTAHNRSPTGSPFVIPVDIQKIRLGGEEGQLSGPHGVDQSVFIDGRKTYINLMPTEAATGGDSTLVNVGIGYTFPNVEESPPQVRPHQSQGSVTNVRLGSQKPVNRPQVQPVNKTPIRIDTCIIGDESACNAQWNETCRVEGGVSSCNCRLGYGRDGLEQGCKPVVSLTVYIKVDRVNHEQISFGPEYQHAESEKYQILEYEAKNAVDSAFSLSALAENFVGSNINSFFSVGGRVIINATVNLLESPQTRSPTIKQEIRRGLISVIQQQHQNIGQSRLYVNGPLNPIPGVQDLNECSDPNLNDCSKHAKCTNAFGSFKCACQEGFLDKYSNDQRRSGRMCAVCSSQYCNNRGECHVSNGIKECKCHGQYIGSQCETDGEVLGVALGASLAALLIIVLTLVCLCMWSRRWKRDQQKMLGRCQGGTLSNSYSYFNKPSAQTADFHLPSDDRIRWPRSSDQFDNFYAQPEPAIPGANPRGYTSTRPPSQPPPPPPPAVITSSSTAHRAVQHLRSLPTTLTSSRSNILDDTDEVDEVNEITTNTNAQRFYFPRPKSRMVNANHGNIYYDVTFPNSRDQYTCNYDKDYGNITDVFPMKTINRPYHS